MRRPAAVAIGRHRTETALRESAERLRFAMQASTVGLWDWDLRTKQVIYSREWKGQLGYEETEIRNEFSEWERLVHPDDLAAAQQRIQRYLAQPESAYEAEFRMRHKDGKWRWCPPSSTWRIRSSSRWWPRASKPRSSRAFCGC